LIESERKRLIELKAVIPADRALTAMKSLLEAVREEVGKLPISDADQRGCLSRIAQRANYLVNVPAKG
jgi:hypothetical protein